MKATESDSNNIVGGRLGTGFAGRSLGKAILQYK